MSRHQYRGAFALAALVAALLSSRTADAQGCAGGVCDGKTCVDPTGIPGTPVNDLITGIKYDRVNQALAVHHLRKAQERLARDAQQCRPDAAGRDARRVRALRYRIVVDEWLIRKNSLCDPGYYPYPYRLDCISCEALAQYGRVPQSP